MGLHTCIIVNIRVSHEVTNSRHSFWLNQTVLVRGPKETLDELKRPMQRKLGAARAWEMVLRR
jgi:hypothetical protein